MGWGVEDGGGVGGVWVGDWEVEEGDIVLHRGKLRKTCIGLWKGKGDMLDYLIINKRLVFEFFDSNYIVKSI